MRTAFDTSAVVKILFDEQGSSESEGWWRLPGRFVSALVYPEARSAVAAASRARRLTSSQALRAHEVLSEAWETAVVIGVDEPLADTAGYLATSTGLKGADAVHLATALSVLEEGDVFVTWDRQLSRAAREHGLAVAP